MNARSCRLAIVVLAVTVGTLAASCYETNLTDCKYACGPGGSCPGAMACVRGMCASPPVVCPNAGLPDGSMDADATADSADEPTDTNDTGSEVSPDAGADADADDGAEADDGADADDGPQDLAEATEASDAPADVPVASPPELVSVGPGLRLVKNKTWKSSTITVCWEKPGNYEEKQWVQDAATDTWAAVSAIRFSGWVDCGDEPSNLRLQFVAPTEIGTPAVGTDADRVPGGVQLRSDEIPGCSLSTRKACVVAYAVHRLGHALGLVHLVGDDDDPAACPAATDGGSADAVTTGGDATDGDVTDADADAAAPEWPDEESVMTFCNPRGFLSTAKLGSRDIEAVASAYGLGPSHFVFHVPSIHVRQVAKFDATGTYEPGKITTLDGVAAAADLMVVGHNKTILLHDDAEGGRFDVGTISDEGDIILHDAVTSVGTWKLIAAAQNGYFVAYAPDRNGGEIAVFRVNAMGGWEGRTYVETNVSTFWTHLAGTLNGGVFFFDRAMDPNVVENNGLGRVARVTPSGKLEVTDAERNKWIFRYGQFDLVTAVGTNTIVLFRTAKADIGVGTGQMLTIDATGARRDLGYMSPAPAYAQAIVGGRNGVLFLFNDARGAQDILTARIGLVDDKGYHYVDSLERFNPMAPMSAD